jgi:hypothetical protein
MGTDGNGITDHLARQGPSRPLTGCEPALGISAEVAGGLSGVGQVGKTRSTGSQFMDKGRLKAFLKDPLLKKLGNYSI